MFSPKRGCGVEDIFPKTIDIENSRYLIEKDYKQKSSDLREYQLRVKVGEQNIVGLDTSCKSEEAHDLRTFVKPLSLHTLAVHIRQGRLFYCVDPNDPACTVYSYCHRKIILYTKNLSDESRRNKK